MKTSLITIGSLIALLVLGGCSSQKDSAFFPEGTLPILRENCNFQEKMEDAVNENYKCSVFTSEEVKRMFFQEDSIGCAETDWKREKYKEAFGEYPDDPKPCENPYAEPFIKNDAIWWRVSNWYLVKECDRLPCTKE